MKRYLITGYSGFVSAHFMDFLSKQEIPASILGLDVSAPPPITERHRPGIKTKFVKIDLMDKDKLEHLIDEFQPDYILHLASYSSVAFSWQNPVASFQNNINIFLSLMEAVRSLKITPRILSIGSSEEYGNVNRDRIPLQEEFPLDPVSPYAVARVSQEMLSRVYVHGYGLDVILTRSFNHIGTGQRDNFVIPSFARQMAELKHQSLTTGELITGDLSVIRDFSDVRDVVAAYHALFEYGHKGEVYNVCSGDGRSLREVIQIMSELLGLDISITVNPALVRPSDNRVIIGSNEKLRRETGWAPKYTLRDSLQDLLESKIAELSTELLDS